MSGRFPSLYATIAGALAAATFIWVGSASSAQLPRSVPVKGGFKIPDYYPNTQKLKALVIGDEAEANLRGPIPITGLKIETFGEDGRTNLVARARHCLFDVPTRTASSTGRLQVVTADGRFFIEGEGFLWRQTNSSLIISNNVRTIIRKGLLQNQSDSPHP